MANGVIHPVTQETLTKYHKIIKVPELKEVWMTGMCIKLGRLLQGYKDTKGTNTIKFMMLEEIKHITKEGSSHMQESYLIINPRRNIPIA